MKHNFRILLSIAVLALAALACQALSGGGDTVDSPEIPEVEIPTFEVPEIEIPDILNGDVLLSDDFSSDVWGTGTDADSSVEYVNDTLDFTVFTENYFVWSTPDGEDYENVHMEVTAFTNGSDSTTAFGLICNMALSGSNAYYVAMTPAGQYALAKAAVGQTDLFLTNNDEWGDTDLITKEQSSYRVGMDCGNGSISLYVDGALIDTAFDSTYTTGNVAVFAWSGEDAGLTTNISFDDFEMTKLP